MILVDTSIWIELLNGRLAGWLATFRWVAPAGRLGAGSD